MFRTTTTRLVSRRLPTVVRHGAKRYYSQPYVATKSSEMPWLLGSVAVTVPAVFWLWSSAPNPDASHDKQHHPAGHSEEKLEKSQGPTSDKTKEAKEEKEEDTKARESEDKSEDEGEDKGGDESEEKSEGKSDNPKDNDGVQQDEGRDKRTYEGTESMQMFGGKPNVTDDTPHAEEKNVGQRHADDDKLRHKTDITKKGPPGMAKTQDTVKK